HPDPADGATRDPRPTDTTRENQLALRQRLPLWARYHPVNGLDARGARLFALRRLLLLAEVPVEDERFPLGVAGDPLPVAPELRIVGGQKLEARQGPLAELVDHVPVAEDALDVPVRSQRPEVDDA